MLFWSGCQAIEFCDDQGGAVGPAQAERLGELWPVGPFAALDLDDLRHQGAPADVSGDGCSLRLEAQP